MTSWLTLVPRAGWDHSEEQVATFCQTRTCGPQRTWNRGHPSPRSWFSESPFLHISSRCQPIPCTEPSLITASLTGTYRAGIFPGGSVVKNLPADAGNAGLIPGSGRSPGGGNGNVLQDSCLDNPMDRGAWWATVPGVAKSQTWLSD